MPGERGGGGSRNIFVEWNEWERRQQNNAIRSGHYICLAALLQCIRAVNTLCLNQHVKYGRSNLLGGPAHGIVLHISLLYGLKDFFCDPQDCYQSHINPPPIWPPIFYFILSLEIFSVRADGGPRSPSAYTWPFARPPIDTSRNFPAHVSAESPLNTYPQPLLIS